jgi:hypothetical protein
VAAYLIEFLNVSRRHILQPFDKGTCLDQIVVLGINNGVSWILNLLQAEGAEKAYLLLSRSPMKAKTQLSTLLGFIECSEESNWHIYKIATSLLSDSKFQQASDILAQLVSTVRIIVFLT